MAYDSKAIKLSKTVKRAAARIIDPVIKGAYLQMHVRLEESRAANKSFRNSKKDNK